MRLSVGPRVIILFKFAFMQPRVKCPVGTLVRYTTFVLLSYSWLRRLVLREVLLGDIGVVGDCSFEHL